MDLDFLTTEEQERMNNEMNKNNILCANFIILIAIMFGVYNYISNIAKDTEITNLKTELNTINITIATENMRRNK